MRRYFVICWLIISSQLVAQEYQVKYYRVGDGLPGNVIKAVEQDSAGFLWIATDDGLVRFDGISFITYKHALRSQYAKGFLKMRDGRLYLFGDLDLVEIDNRIDTVIFRQMQRGTRIATDSTLWYPKSMYEDRQGDLWLGEPQSVVRIHNGALLRFKFDERERSALFLRSFSFFEDNAGILYAVSFHGHVFRFNPDESIFVETDIPFPDEINDVRVRPSTNELWIAARNGLHVSLLHRDHGYTSCQKFYNAVNPSHLLMAGADRIFVSGFEEEHYWKGFSNESLSIFPTGINSVNSAFLSNENDLWLATNEGLILLHKNLFEQVMTPGKNDFVEGIGEDPVTHTIYHSTMRHLFSIPEMSLQPQSNASLTVDDGYFQSIASGDQGIWVSNKSSVLLLHDNRIFRQWDFKAHGGFINNLAVDKNQTLWMAQSGNQQVMSIDKDFKEKFYNIPLNPESHINNVRPGSDGVYAVSTGENGYLFFKAHEDSVFNNISVPVRFTIHGDFNIIDLQVVGKTIWLASSEGLLRYQEGRISRVDLGDLYTRLAVKVVRQLDEEHIAFTNTFGLFRYNISSGDYWLYDESTGLPSNTITTRGLFVDHQRRVWVGTSVGLAFTRNPLITGRKTLTPYFVSAEVNGILKRFMEGLTLPYGSYLRLTASAITFPEKKMQLEYRILEIDSSWHTITDNQVNLSDLSFGNYRVDIRAKKNGGYAWSDVRSMNILVEKPFWRQYWFFSAMVVIFIIVAWSSYATALYLSSRRRRQLETIVNQRTMELRTLNDELSVRNGELDRFVYSVSHDLNAPLRSIRGLISVARLDDPEHAQLTYLEKMETSVNKLEAFIEEVINYSRNTRLPVKLEPIQFGEFIEELLQDHQYAPGFNKIKFIVEDHLHTTFLSDEMRLKVIFNNLISNAIKFHDLNSDHQPFVKITAKEVASVYFFTVEDNGPGIPEDLSSKIFDMFFRATDAAPGSGLGLYILKESVHRLGGDVVVDSEMKKGTTFSISLPKLSPSG